MGPFFGTDGRSPGSVVSRHFLRSSVLLRWRYATAGAAGYDATAG